MAEFRLSPAAERDLEGIWKHTRDEWGLKALAASPMSAPACEHIRRGYRRRGVGRHMVYFRVTVYGIAVIRVLHERMDALRHF